MNRRFIIFLVSLLGIALICIILIQLIWIRRAYQENSIRFETGVREALDRVAMRLQQKDAYSILSKKVDIDLPPPDVILPDIPGNEQLRFVYENHEGYSDTTILLLRHDDLLPAGVDEKLLHTEIEKRKNHDFRWTYHETQADSLIEAEIQLNVKKNRLREKVSGVVDVFRKMVIEVSTEDLPIDKRLSTEMIRQDLSKYLANKGVDLPFEFAVMKESNDSLTSLRSPGFTEQSKEKSYAVALFPDDLILEPYRLLVEFPGQRAFIYRSFSWMTLSSVIFTAAIILAFAFTVHLLLKQKKLSDMKSDFINNLTHEFKTPIATIAVAIDSIENAKVISDPEKILPITRMIREENIRMNHHVEQVLQIAILDKGIPSLLQDEVDLSFLILRAAESVKIRLDQMDGSISIEFKAASHLVKGNEMHLYNIIQNLLDNAIKYSPKNPAIRIITRDHHHELIIQVEDQGQGMSKEAQKRIFEKFYRVPAGNIHNVKGFGLGLSYVKAIVESHGGKVSVVWSEPGRGSCFEIRLPVYKLK